MTETGRQESTKKRPTEKEFQVEGVEILQCIDAVNEVAQEECEEERGAWDGSQDPYYLKG